MATRKTLTLALMDPPYESANSTTALRIIDAAANRVLFTPESTPDEIMQALADWVEANPGDGWIRGGQCPIVLSFNELSNATSKALLV